MKYTLISFVAILVKFLSACRPAATPVPDTATPEPTFTNTPVPPTFTPTPTLTPLPTQTPTSTPTRTPTKTLTPTPEPTSVLNNTAQEVLKSHGIDPSTGKIVYTALGLDELEEETKNSVSWTLFEGLGEIEDDDVMQYEVRGGIRRFPIWLWRVLLYIDNDLNFFNEGYRLIGFSVPGFSIWAVEYVKDEVYDILAVEPKAASFKYKKDSPVTFTLVVKGSQVDFYFGANRIGRFTTLRTSGKAGLLAYNLTGEGKRQVHLRECWIWSENFSSHPSIGHGDPLQPCSNFGTPGPSLAFNQSNCKESRDNHKQPPVLPQGRSASLV